MTLRHWLIVIGSGLLMSLQVLVFMGGGMMLPPMAVSLGVSLGSVMIFTSITALAGAAGMSVAGPMLLRRLGVRPLILVGGVVTGVSLFAVSYVTGLPGLYLTALAAGILGPLSFQMAGAVLVNDWFIQRRGTMLGVVMSIASLGGVVAGTLLPAVVLSGGWQLGFRVVGVITLAVAVLCGVFLIRARPSVVGLRAYGADDDTTQGDVGRSHGSARAMFTSRQFVTLMAGLTLYSALMAMQQHFPSLMREHGLTLALAGTLLAVLSIANVGATLGFGAINDRFGPVVAAALATVLLVASLALFAASSGLVPQAVAILVYAIPAITPPILTPIVFRFTFGDRHLVALLGVGMATMPIGVAFGSPLWGLVKDLTGSYTLGLYMAMGIAALALVLVSYALITGPKRWLASSPSEQEPLVTA
ncbi:MAG: MFS transporter [Propionibacteriaceae bacterium]